MKINQTMLDILQEIRLQEPRKKASQLDVPMAELGYTLISYYYSTSSLATRQLIREFMEQAGFKWVRRLITRDLDAQTNSVQFAGLTEYVRLAAANDPRAQWSRTGS